MKKALFSWLAAFILPALYGWLAYWIINSKMIFDTPGQVMLLCFLIGVPAAMGYLTVAFSDMKRIQSKAWCRFAPWIPIAFFMSITLILQLEGLACWIMICPVWMLISSIVGSRVGRNRRQRDDDSRKLQGSWLLLLPILGSPIEGRMSSPQTQYEVYTYTDIHAPAETIWNNVVRVRTIEEKEDHGKLTKFLGFPRPIRAELDYAGVGGSRKAIFSGGLIFEEVVKEYAAQQKMQFSIKADPASIPPTTMDEHIVVGGQYFDVLDGTYRLEKITEDKYRLHLYSHFVLKTHFNWYASLWASWIMKDIQNNILQVIQTRCAGNL